MSVPLRQPAERNSSPDSSRQSSVPSPQNTWLYRIVGGLARLQLSCLFRSQRRAALYATLFVFAEGATALHLFDLFRCIGLVPEGLAEQRRPIRAGRLRIAEVGAVDRPDHPVTVEAFDRIVEATDRHGAVGTGCDRVDRGPIQRFRSERM